MTKQQRYTIKTSLIVALGGFLMGFDASVISGVIRFIEPQFELSKVQIGWVVSSLTLTSTLAMMVAGPISTRYGRKIVLSWAALFYAVSAIASALAPSYTLLVIARMLGGFGVGASLIIAPMYIAEIAPPNIRGRLVSLNQLNIVLGISLAFFTNYLIFDWSKSDYSLAINWNLKETAWRFMLGLEAIPALVYWLGLFRVPESPRWLVMCKRDQEALAVFQQVSSESRAIADLELVRKGLEKEQGKKQTPWKELLKPAFRLVLLIGILVAVLQQITGINSVFFYAPMIFEQSGIGADASFIQASLVGLTNLIFTILAILFIDRFGRKVLLLFGLSGIAISMFLISYGFANAHYELDEEDVALFAHEDIRMKLASIQSMRFESDIEFKTAIKDLLTESEYTQVESEMMAYATHMDSLLVLLGILAFVASFAISIGPVMWVLFSEIFPNYIRGLAISFVGFINSAVSFTVQLVFPWELDALGSSTTFLIYGVFAFLGLIVIARILPETKNKSLEELEAVLIKTE